LIFEPDSAESGMATMAGIDARAPLRQKINSNMDAGESCENAKKILGAEQNPEN
jgi:hypothetical protein